MNDASAPAEARLAPLQKRLRPFAHVIRRKAIRKRLRLVVEALIDRAFAAFENRVENPRERNRRRRRELIGDGRDFLVELVRRDDAIDDAERERALRIDLIPEKAKLERGRPPRKPRQPLRAAESRNEPEIDLRLSDLRLLAR